VGPTHSLWAALFQSPANVTQGLFSGLTSGAVHDNANQSTVAFAQAEGTSTNAADQTTNSIQAPACVQGLHFGIQQSLNHNVWRNPFNSTV
jgi:hypothetical protein